MHEYAYMAMPKGRIVGEAEGVAEWPPPLPSSPLDFWERSTQGQFGNTPLAFTTWAEFEERADGDSRFWVASKRPDDPFRIYSANKLDLTHQVATRRGFLQGFNDTGAYHTNCIFVEEPGDDAKRHGQFRLCYSSNSQPELQLDLGSGLPLGQAIRAGHYTTYNGFAHIQHILSAILDWDSYDMLMALVSRYPTGVVVEATNYTQPVGRLGMGLLIWEVRGGRY